MSKMMTVLAIAAALCASAALAQQPGCKGTYLLGEKVPPGCSQQPQDFGRWDDNRPAITTHPQTGPTVLPVPQQWQVTCDAAGRCKKRE